MLNTGLGFSDEFELETLRHLEKSGRRGKHYKEFLRNVKDKVGFRKKKNSILFFVYSPELL